MNIFEAPPIPGSSTLSQYNNAVNASRFVKGFGIAVLVYSVLSSASLLVCLVIAVLTVIAIALTIAKGTQ